MELKTKIHAAEGKQDLLITREFELPLELLFRAYADADIVAEWMGTRVLKLENRQHGSWQFETCDAQGNPVFQANGTIHAFIPNEKIVRTFEMNNAPFDVQLEFLEFTKITDDSSQLRMQIVYRSVELRDQMLKLPFAKGLNMAHNKLEKTMQQSN